MHVMNNMNSHITIAARMRLPILKNQITWFWKTQNMIYVEISIRSKSLMRNHPADNEQVEELSLDHVTPTAKSSSPAPDN